MKKINLFSTVLSILIVSFVNLVEAQSQVKGVQVNKKTDNRVLLNLWGEQPAEVRDLYNAAYNVLSNRADATYQDLFLNPAIKSLCLKSGIRHLGGPMLGNISPTSVDIWIRTLYPSKVEVKVNANGNEKNFGPAISNKKTDLSAIVHVKGLQPETKYNYQVYIDGIEIQPSEQFNFHTPSENNESIRGRIIFGSCFHRWGLGNYNQSEQIIDRNPDAILFMGDVAVQDRTNNLGMHRADYLLRDFIPAWKKLVASVPVYVTWDDHDYFNDDLAGIPDGFTKEDKEKVWNVFRYAWNNPSYGFGEKKKGVFFRTRVGPADIIMVDNRYFRNGMPGTFLGDEQMKWLKTQLLDCKGPFIILSCGTMWSDYVDNGKDSWGVNDPEGREELFRFIEKNNISGVLLISGDRHGARGFQIPRKNGFNFYEFGAASLGGRVGPPASDSSWTTQLYGITGKYAFGEFTFSGHDDNPEVAFKLIGDDGTLIYEKKIKRSQLTPSMFNDEK